MAPEYAEHKAAEMEGICSKLESLIESLREMDLKAWHREGQDLLEWMQREAEDMENAEKNVAITKAAGGSGAILGGVMAGVGIATSVFTFGLTAPLAVAGLALCGAGAATSAGGNIAQLSILHMKTCKIKKRCESFQQSSESIVKVLGELCKIKKHLAKDFNNIETSVIDIVLKSRKSAVNLVAAGINSYNVATLEFDNGLLREVLREAGVISGGGAGKSGASCGRLASVSRAWAVAVEGIAFGIWDVVDAAGTLQNGGSHAKLIRDNASRLRNTIQEIENALYKLDVMQH